MAISGRPLTPRRDALAEFYLNPITLGYGTGLERISISIRLGRRRKPVAEGFIERNGVLPVEREGIAISTFDKVIKRGWESLGLAPAAGAHITGLIEAPELAACLTLSKNDFIRTGARGGSYLAYRKAIQEVVSRQLADWGGDARDMAPRPRTIRLERDLERVLEDLADDFPLLRSLVDRRVGGQKRLPMPGRGNERVPAPLVADAAGGFAPDDAWTNEEGTTAAPPEGIRPPEPGAAMPPKERQPSPPQSAASGTVATVAGRRRHARYGLTVQIESRPDDVELGRLVDSTIWINDAHPAFRRAEASRSVGYHTALAVALTLAPLAVEPSHEHAFVTQFLAHWGSAHGAGRVNSWRSASKT